MPERYGTEQQGGAATTPRAGTERGAGAAWQFTSTGPEIVQRIETFFAQMPRKLTDGKEQHADLLDECRQLQGLMPVLRQSLHPSYYPDQWGGAGASPPGDGGGTQYPTGGGTPSRST